MALETHIAEPATLPLQPEHVGGSARGILVAVLLGALVAVAAVLGAQRVLRSRKSPDVRTSMEQGPPQPAGASSSAVFISSAKQQLIGVRTGLVEHEQAGATTRTVGVLAYDETRVTHIHVKVAGWVEQLFVDYVGKRVRRGEPLFAVYSPDLVTAQSDYLIALRSRQQLGDKSLPDARSTSDALVRASRDRLLRWDVTDTEITALEASGKPSRTVTLFAPFDGIVLERNTFAGQYVTPDMNTFKVGDLSKVWAIGQAFEYEASHLRVGEMIDVEFPYAQAPQTLKAQIDFIYPDVDPQTRRIRFRATLLNKDGRLKPETYVTLVLHGETVDRLVVPKEAVIDTGVRTYVMLALPDGYFDPRDVQVGAAVGDIYPVVSGLAAGDRVVTSAQFLVDSETNLKSAMQNMAATMPGMNMGESKPPSSTPSTTRSATSPIPRIPMPSSQSKAPPPSMSSMPGM